jgi:sec-independent protein translocase protein TatC
MAAAPESGLDETRYSLLEHLSELRTRLVRALLAVTVTMSGAMYFAPELLDYAIKPLREVLAAKNRAEVLLVDREAARAQGLVDALEAKETVRFRGRVDDLGAAREAVLAALDGKQPLDLLLVSADTIGADGALVSDVLEGIEPAPLVAYLVRDPRDPAVAELQLDGATLIREAPRPAVLSRLVRQAAALSGKVNRGDKLVVLSLFDPFFAYLKIALVVGLFLACPVWLHQLWSFIAPGLYDREKRVVLPAVLGASLLFLAGGLFAYFVMFPLMFDVLVNQMMPASLEGSFTVENYLSMLLTMTVVFGLVFEVPLIIALLTTLGLVSVEALRRFRKYAIVLSFVIGAVATPADPVSQVLMSVPLVIFYEVGILLSAMLARRRGAARRAAEEAEELEGARG